MYILKYSCSLLDLVASSVDSLFCFALVFDTGRVIYSSPFQANSSVEYKSIQKISPFTINACITLEKN